MKRRKLLIGSIIISLMLSVGLFLNLNTERFDIEASQNEIKEVQKDIKNNKDNKGNDKHLVAVLSINGIVKDVPVFDNAEDTTLLKGAGILEGSTALNEVGNTFVGGHRETVFNSLDKLKEGDIIEVKTLKDKKIFNYKIHKIKIIKNDDTYNFYEQTNKNLLVLYTCYPIKEISKNPKEIIVFYADLIE